MCGDDSAKRVWSTACGGCCRSTRLMLQISPPVPAMIVVKNSRVPSCEIEPGVCKEVLVVRRSSSPLPSAARQYNVRDPDRVPRYTRRRPSEVQNGAWLLPLDGSVVIVDRVKS